jgi:uncharacterized membrane protein
MLEPLKNTSRRPVGAKGGGTFSGGLEREPEAADMPCWQRATPWLLAGIVVLGLALRIYRLSSQSVWMDEFFGMVTLSDPSWKGYFSSAGFYMPDNMPLAWVIRYGCAKIISPTWLLGTRMEQVLFGVACIPLVYLLGKSVFGRQAGLLAALCVALSPVHVWIAQDLRPNVLIELLAVVSMVSFVMGLRSDGLRWWILNVIANLCLVWTHLFLVFFVAAECCFMAVHLRSRFRRTVVWGAVQCAICLSPMLWLGVHFASTSDADEDFYRSLPSLHDLVFDLIGDDAVRVTDPFAFQGQTWKFLPPHVQQAVDAWHGVFDAALALFFGACALWALVRVCRSWRRPFRFADHVGRPEIFLLIMVFLPPLLLFLGSWVFRPMLMPRYTSYCSFALYVLAGGVLAGFHRVWIRRIALTALIALYGYQLSLALPANTRTDWRSACSFIRAQAAPGDIVLAKGNMGTRIIYQYNARLLPSQRTAPDPVVVPAYTLQSVVDKSERALSGPTPSGAVWAVVERFVYSMPPLADFEACLASRGLACTRTDFPGMNGIQVYRIVRAPHTEAAASPPCRLEGTFADYPGLLADMGLSETDGPEYAAALDSLHRIVDCEWPRSKFYYAFLGLFMCDERQSAMAVRAARRSVRMDPGYAFGHFAVAVAEYEDGKPDAGDEAFARAVACDTTGNFTRYGPLLRALYHPKAESPLGTADPSSLIADLEFRGIYLPYVFHLRSGTLPGVVAALNGPAL